MSSENGPYADDFPDALIGQSQTLGFDFGNFLPAGVTLTGTPTVVATVIEGTNPAPDAEFTSAAAIGTISIADHGTGRASAAIKRRFTPTIANVHYLLVATCTRSDGDVAIMSSHVWARAAE